MIPYDHLLICYCLCCRTVPTEDQILVPETLLKKRKSQEKAREDRLAEQKKRKAVGIVLVILVFVNLVGIGTVVMISTNFCD